MATAAFCLSKKSQDEHNIVFVVAHIDSFTAVVALVNLVSFVIVVVIVAVIVVDAAVQKKGYT